MDDIRRLELIDLFVGTLIPHLGFTGDDAMHEEHDLREALTEHRSVDWDALLERAPHPLRKGEVRAQLVEQGTFAEDEADVFIAGIPDADAVSDAAQV